jgi:predicted AAA+ superfamily ATPase
MFIKRENELASINKLREIFPVVAIIGPRQCGKTTLARQISFNHYFDLENPRDIIKFEQPQLTLESLSGTIIIDEIQRLPNLFTLLRYLVDQRSDQRYIILGSASRDLLRQSSESLSGRIGYYHLGGFSLDDIGYKNLRKLWLRGGLPLSYLAVDEEQSILWRENYITTFLERDIPQLGITIPSQTLRRFWTMLSHYHAQIINYAELGRSFGISDMTVRKYIDILEATFMIRVLQPWYINMKKRLIKRPKIYFKDSGLFHSLSSIENMDQLLSHNKLGASWEGFALECICRYLKTDASRIYFWGTHTGAEVDLFWQKGGKNWAVEFKYMDAPKITKSMQIALENLSLSHLYIIYPGNDYYQLSEKISVLSIKNFTQSYRV